MHMCMDRFTLYNYLNILDYICNNYIVYRCLRSSDLVISSYASLMIFHRLWSMGVWLPFLIFKQRTHYTGKTSVSQFHKTGLKASPSHIYLQFFLYFFWFLNSRNRNPSTLKKIKGVGGGKQSKIWFQLRSAAPSKNHSEDVRAAKLRWSNPLPPGKKS